VEVHWRILLRYNGPHHDRYRWILKLEFAYDNRYFQSAELKYFLDHSLPLMFEYYSSEGTLIRLDLQKCLPNMEQTVCECSKQRNLEKTLSSLYRLASERY